MGILDIFGVETVSVETYQGSDTYGESWASIVTVTGCWVDDQTHLIRSAKDEEVVSQSVVFAPISSAALWVENSRVTLPNDDRTRRVINVNTNNAAGLPLPEHVEVHLT